MTRPHMYGGYTATPKTGSAGWKVVVYTACGHLLEIPLGMQPVMNCPTCTAMTDYELEEYLKTRPRS